jgi:UDP-3-O-[3-hydroxymyristoyl] glucosamine N-acyltransferase
VFWFGNAGHSNRAAKLAGLIRPGANVRIVSYSGDLSGYRRGRVYRFDGRLENAYSVQCMRSHGSRILCSPSADVSPKAQIGEGTKIWHHCQVREGAVLGRNCILSKGVYIDTDVRVGNNVKIQNGISVYHGVTLEDGVFCGPHCVFTNDRQPRAINPDGSLKSVADWVVSETYVKTGASIGLMPL